MFLKDIKIGQKVLILFLSSFLIILIFLFYFGNSLITYPVEKPEEKPANVPVDAKYSMGNWFELVNKIDSKTYHIRIYNRFSGSLNLDGIFKFDSNDHCLEKLDTTNILNNARFYNRKIFLSNHKNTGTLKCFLNLTELIKSGDTITKQAVKMIEKKISK